MASAPRIQTQSPVRFIFERGGGAVVWARVDVWADAGGTDERRVAVLFFDDSLDEVETISRSLPSGDYVCIFKAFVREDLNGTYRYTHRIGTQDVFTDSGDVNTGPTPGESQGFRDQYVLSVS